MYCGVMLSCNFDRIMQFSKASCPLLTFHQPVHLGACSSASPLRWHFLLLPACLDPPWLCHATGACTPWVCRSRQVAAVGLVDRGSPQRPKLGPAHKLSAWPCACPQQVIGDEICFKYSGAPLQAHRARRRRHACCQALAALRHEACPAHAAPLLAGNRPLVAPLAAAEYMNLYELFHARASMHRQVSVRCTSPPALASHQPSTKSSATAS